MMTRMPVDGGQHPGPGFENQRVVVTGGARGIGASIVRTFAAEGAKIVIVDLLIEEATVLAGDIGGHALKCDLADPVDTMKVMNDSISVLGGIDILINNAGVLKVTPLLDISAEEWDWVFAINTRAMLLTTQVAARAMIDQRSGGKIVNTASMGGKVGAANQAHYAASKAAVISLTQVSAAELGAHGINVNCVCPGYVLTEMGAATRTDEMVAEWSALSPLGRLANPSEIASMALFLASEDASYCTGQAMNVSGGMISH